MKKLTTLALCLVLALSLAACGSPKESETQPTEAPVQIANPYVTCEDAASMQELAGLEVSLPESLPCWVNETIYRTIPGELVEVIYAGDTNEIRVRIANGSRDISGVYGSQHSQETDIAMGSYTVHCTGDAAEDGSLTLFVCTWTTQDGRTYSVTSPEGVPQGVMETIIPEIV